MPRTIAVASEQGVDAKFTTLVAALKASDTFNNLEQLQGVIEKNVDLRNDLRRLIELLLKDDTDEARRKRALAFHPQAVPPAVTTYSGTALEQVTVPGPGTAALTPR